MSNKCLFSDCPEWPHTECDETRDCFNNAAKDTKSATPLGQAEFDGCAIGGGTPGAELILAERARQIAEERWNEEHDNHHDKWEIASAARCYALPLVKSTTPVRPDWPWHEKWWKPSDDPIQNLIKAGALIAAEIDRLRRK